jgi:hypothetical protein
LRGFEEIVMVNTDTVKLELVQEIIDLPDELLPRVREFLTALSSNKREVPANGAPSLPLEQDPLLKLIGLVDEGSLPTTSVEIDELLYGKNPL